MIIRTATVEDVPRVRELRRRAFVAHAQTAYSPAEVENLLHDLDEQELIEMAREAQLFVGVASNEIVGSSGWRGTSLRHVYVEPGGERAGLGSQLVVHAERD